MKTYVITYTATYAVEAANLDDAIEAAIQEHENLPNGTWDAEVAE